MEALEYKEGPARTPKTTIRFLLIRSLDAEFGFQIVRVGVGVAQLLLQVVAGCGQGRARNQFSRQRSADQKTPLAGASHIPFAAP